MGDYLVIVVLAVGAPALKNPPAPTAIVGEWEVEAATRGTQPSALW